MKAVQNASDNPSYIRGLRATAAADKAFFGRHEGLCLRGVVLDVLPGVQAEFPPLTCTYMGALHAIPRAWVGAPI